MVGSSCRSNDAGVVLEPVDWRKARRGRVELARLEALTVPLADVDLPMTESVRRAATLFEQLGVSNVVYVGYGMGEAGAVAASIAPDRIEPLADRLDAFSDDQIVGRIDSHSLLAVTARNDLLDTVSEIAHANPKPAAVRPI
jgi:pimeloyl-ACP methyl ester carboxylesterase